MTTKGHCEEETQDKLKEYGKLLYSLKDLERMLRTDHLLLTRILVQHAKRIDHQERRLILVENRVYKGGSKPPCG